MSSLVIVFNVNIFIYHLWLQCLHTFLGVISGRKTESMRDFYLCYPAILTNTLVPQLGLSSILQNQLGVALDALTISPFLVIDDKLVEVFNGNKSMWNVKDLGIVFISGKGSPEDVHISNLLLECKCTWQVVLVEIHFNLWWQSTMHVKVYEDNDMHNGKWTSAEWDKCGIYRRTCGIYLLK